MHKNEMQEDRMPKNKTRLTRDDILTRLDYEKIRLKKREEILKIKKKRRVPVGPYAVFLFENWDTLWWQIHEMLRIEKGGDAQITDELAAYTPLIPRGSEWVATLMFEIENPQERAKILAQLGHVEKKIYLQFRHHQIPAVAVGEEERTSPTGKTSAVHFLRFSFSPDQKKVLLEETSAHDCPVSIEANHPFYTHRGVLSQEVFEELKKDLF